MTETKNQLRMLCGAILGDKYDNEGWRYGRLGLDDLLRTIVLSREEDIKDLKNGELPQNLKDAISYWVVLIKKLVEFRELDQDPALQLLCCKVWTKILEILNLLDCWLDSGFCQQEEEFLAARTGRFARDDREPDGILPTTLVYLYYRILFSFPTRPH